MQIAVQQRQCCTNWSTFVQFWLLLQYLSYLGHFCLSILFDIGLFKAIWAILLNWLPVGFWLHVKHLHSHSLSFSFSFLYYLRKLYGLIWDYFFYLTLYALLVLFWGYLVFCTILCHVYAVWLDFVQFTRHLSIPTVLKYTNFSFFSYNIWPENQSIWSITLPVCRIVWLETQ